jgi:hypothetical protein
VDSLGTSSGALIVSGGAGIAKSLNVGVDATINRNLTVNANSILQSCQLYDTHDATNSASGALVVAGGCGILKSLNVGSDATVNGNLTAYGNTIVQTLQLYDTHDATKSMSGALVVAGGASIAKDLYIGVDLHIGGSIKSNWSTITPTVGGGAIGTTNDISFELLRNDIVLVKFVGYTNNGGSNYSSIYTSTGAVPSAFRPSADVYIPMVLIADNNNVLGYVHIQTDGTILWVHSFSENDINGWNTCSLTYPL